jgi:O-antigen/teichoic acid export membrane protein
MMHVATEHIEKAPGATPAGGKSALLRSGVIVGIGIGGGSVLHSVFHLALARILGPGEYSLLAALLAVILIATPPTLALQAAIAREVAWRLAHEDEAAAGAALRATGIALLRRGLAFAVLAALAGAVLAIADNAISPLALFATGLTLAGMFALPLFWGGLQGEQSFVELSLAQVCFALLKLCAGIAIGLAGGGAAAVVAGIALAAGATAGLSYLPLRRAWSLGADIPRLPRRIIRGFAGGPTAVLTLFALLSGLDVLVARLAFDPDTAGQYAAVSFGARTMLVIPLAVTTVLFPRVATMADRKRERRHLLAGLAAVAALGAVATAVLFAIPETLIRIAFGADYLGAADWLGPLGIAMTLFALVNVYAFHFLSLGQSQYAAILAALAAVQLTLYALFHGSPDDLIAVLTVSAVLLLVASETFDLVLNRRRVLSPDRQAEVGYRPMRPLAEPASLRRYAGVVSVVMPAFDEEERIVRAIEETHACMTQLGCRFEIVIVDDGSLDDTRRLAEEAARRAGGGLVRVVGYSANAGKGEATVTGARVAIGDLVLFADADLEVHPRQLQVLYERLVHEGADVVIGSKLHPASHVDYPLKRRIVSWGYYAVVRSFFSLPVRDTQTGLKLFSGSALDRIVPRMLVKRFGYDLEMLVIAQRLGYRIVEAPVIVTRERDLPRIGLRDIFFTARDTAAIWYRTYLRRYYDRLDPAEETAPELLTPDAVEVAR